MHDGSVSTPPVHPVQIATLLSPLCPPSLAGIGLAVPEYFFLLLTFSAHRARLTLSSYCLRESFPLACDFLHFSSRGVRRVLSFRGRPLYLTRSGFLLGFLYLCFFATLLDFVTHYIIDSTPLSSIGVSSRVIIYSATSLSPAFYFWVSRHSRHIYLLLHS